MAKYIEKEAAIDSVHGEFDECLVLDSSGLEIANVVENILDTLPPADVRPVVRGRWVDEHIYKQTMSGKTYDGFTYCSNCKHDFCFGYRSKFCPNCGADMRDIENKEPVDKFEDWPDKLKQTYRELLKKLYFIGGDAE